ncbi:hypothetical protein TK43_15200 [Roseovarius sp. JS7-11]|nr:hypothetical protein TK43_15200 [Roseovarius sp. JS7-11]
MCGGAGGQPAGGGRGFQLRRRHRIAAGQLQPWTKRACALATLTAPLWHRGPQQPASPVSHHRLRSGMGRRVHPVGEWRLPGIRSAHLHPCG